MAANYKANYKLTFNDHRENDEPKVLELMECNTYKLNIIIGKLVEEGRVMRKDFKEGGTAKVEKF